MRGEQRGGFLDRGEVPAVAVAVGDHHVQELPRRVPGPAGVQDAGHLGQPGLHGGSQTAVPLDHQEAAVVVRGDQQRDPHPGLRDGRQELRGQVQILPDVPRMGDELVNGDHVRGLRTPRQSVRLSAFGGGFAAGGHLGHGKTPFS